MSEREHELLRVLVDQNDRILRLLSRVLASQGYTERMEHLIMDELSTLKAKVAANKSLIGSIIARDKGLSEQIAALKTDPAALQALSDSLDADAQSWADSIVANTPAATIPVVPTA